MREFGQNLQCIFTESVLSLKKIAEYRVKFWIRKSFIPIKPHPDEIQYQLPKIA